MAQTRTATQVAALKKQPEKVLWLGILFRLVFNTIIRIDQRFQSLPARTTMGTAT